MTSAEPVIRSPHYLPGRHLQNYVGVAGHWDEAVLPDGSIRPAWQRFADALASQMVADFQGRQDLCRRVLRESGVTYTPPDRELHEQRPWLLDSWPLLISPDEWQLLSTAVSQRARVLNSLLSDIYGPRRLLKTGDLPPEIVFANPAFIRAAHELTPPDGIYLNLYAVDVARSPDGRWWVIGDRTDTPAGAGYALENRIVMNRVYPELIRDCQVHRLARFFQQLRDGLLARGAGVRDREPRVVIYTPGPYHSTYFEQSYLARYLGFNLVEGRDLTVRDQGVFLKTLSGLLPVDVILRRVDSDFCDPLELRGDSLLGVGGLLQSARAGNVVIANSIGSGVIETPALLSFLPNLCRRLLGEELLLPPLATWWCGQAPALEAVVRQVDRLVVKQAFGSAPATFLPGQIPREELVARLTADPHLYVGQECVALSTAPTWQDQRLEPRHLMMRLYAVAVTANEYVVMPGGLTRSGNSSESILLSAQTGGGSKDTWMLSDTPPDGTTLLSTHSRPSALSRAGFILPSRLADDLFWLGRYVERIEFGCRLTRCLLHRMTNESEFGQPAELMHLVDLLEAHGRLPEDWTTKSASALQEVLVAVVFDRANPSGIAGDVSKVRRIAMGVRDRLSIDAWRILTELSDDLVPATTSGRVLDSARLSAMDLVLEKLAAFSGLAADGMTRDMGWVFLEIGRRLERVTDLCDLLLHSVIDPNPAESTRLLALLEIANSAMTYQSRYVFGPDVARVLDLLLADETNPRSIVFQLATLYRHVRALRRAIGSGRFAGAEPGDEYLFRGSAARRRRRRAAEPAGSPNPAGLPAEAIDAVDERAVDAADSHLPDARATAAAPGESGAMIYEIVHTTEYQYAMAAEACHNLLRLDPRTIGAQTCLEMKLAIDPEPGKLHTYIDYFGNQVRSFAVLEPHYKLSITSTSRVDVAPCLAADVNDSLSWSDVRRLVRAGQDDASIDALQYVFNSMYVRAGEALRQYAQTSFPAETPVLAGAFDLTRRIQQDFAYDQSATTIDTSVEDVLERRCGVCQDFAHLQIACLRSLGLPARYVSGYLRTQNHADQPRLEGADASHAWVSIYCPRNGWTDFDPTNGCLVADGHIVLGWGRDFHDVSPVKGVVLGGAGSKLRVAVDVRAI